MDFAVLALQQHLRDEGRFTKISVDLERQVVTDVDGGEHAFAFHPLRRRCLLEGLDDMSLTAQFLDVIQPFEIAYRRQFPWLTPPRLDATAKTSAGQDPG